MIQNYASIIIPMYNASPYIKDCLSSLVKQTTKDFEVILVDDCSTDDTIQKAKEYPFKIIKLKERVTAAKVRNYGVGNASGNILIFIDADVVLQPDSIESIIHLISEPGIDAISGIYSEDTIQANFFSQLQNLILVYRYSRLPASTILTCSFFCAIKRDTFENIGGYNEKMSYYEDIEIGHRLTEKGYHCKFNPSLKVTHLKLYSHFSLLQDYFKKAAAAASYIKYKNSIKQLGENGWPFSIKIASISSGCILFFFCLIKVSPIPFMVSLGVHLVSILPLFLYLVNKRNMVFAFKSYLVLFEIFLTSIFGLTCGILAKNKNA